VRLSVSLRLCISLRFCMSVCVSICLYHVQVSGCIVNSLSISKCPSKVCLCVQEFVYLFKGCLFMCLRVCLSMHKDLSIYLKVCLPVCPRACLYVQGSICLCVQRSAVYKSKISRSSIYIACEPAYPNSNRKL